LIARDVDQQSHGTALAPRHGDYHRLAFRAASRWTRVTSLFGFDAAISVILDLAVGDAFILPMSSGRGSDLW
jgi:hypothetical protein